MVFKSRYADVEPDARFKGLVSNFFWHQLDVFSANTLLLDYVSKREWTGAQIKQASSTMALNLIQEYGFKANSDCVSFYYNCDYLQLASMALLFAGGSICAGAPEDPEQEHLHMLEVMRPAFVLTEHLLVDQMLRIRSNSNGQLQYHIIIMNDRELSDAQFKLFEDKASGIRMLGFHRHLYGKMGEEARPELAVELPVQVHPDRPAFVLLTSGSTGRPKPVGRTQRNSLYVCHSLNGAAGDDLWDLNEKSVLAGHLQLDHGTGTFCLKLTLAKGLKMIVMHGYEYNMMLDAIRTYRISDICLGSALLHNFIDKIMSASSGLKSDSDLASLRRLLAVGSPIASQELINNFMQRFGSCVISQAYGMTEVGFVAIGDRMRTARLDSVGYLLPNLTIKVVARTGNAVGSEISSFNTEGELYVSGPTVSPGYLGAQYNEQSLANFLSDGFYKTNDICQMLEGGQIKIFGRYSEILCLHDGWKVLPSEVEQTILKHPLIREAAVIGIPHPDLPTCHAPRAYVVPKEGVDAEFDTDFELALLQSQEKFQSSDNQNGNHHTKDESSSLTKKGPANEQDNKVDQSNAGKLTKQMIFDFTVGLLSEPKQLVGGIRILHQLPRISIGKFDKKLLRKLDGY